MMWSTVLLFCGVCLFKRSYVSGHCIDIHSHIVSQGLHYVPGPNTCTLCICDKGSPKWCKSVLCSPPQNCKSFQLGNSCCEFKCLDDILTANDGYKDTYDLTLRLIGSSVTAVLSIFLLFFVIHRLRKRKVRGQQNRQLNEDQRSLNSIGYIAGSLGYLPGSIGYLGSGNNDMEFHYEESGAHFSLWKPPGNYFPRGEAPPPYEEAIRTAQVENNVVTTQMQLENSVPNPHVNSINVPLRRVMTGAIQCRHDNVIITANTNNREYTNATSQGVHQPTDHIHKIVDMSVNNAHSETRINHKVYAQDKKCKSSTGDRSGKSKSYENIISVRNDRPTINTEPKSSKQKEIHKPSNVKLNKYENITQKSNNTASNAKAGESITHIFDDVSSLYENTRHRTIPALTDFHDIDISLMRSSRSKDSVHLLTTNNSRQTLEKANICDSSDKNLKTIVILKDRKDMPLHRTLPKNLKELNIQISSNTELIPIETFKRSETDHLMHRLLPKQLTTHDTSLSLSLVKNLNAIENNFKEFGAQKSSDVRSSPSNRLNALDSRSEEASRAKNVSREDERRFISYQCLSSSQDDDDYRSECENCKSSGFTSIENEEDDVLNETMTLQRRPLESCEEVPYYRTSLTLPTHTRKPRTTMSNPGRESWFTAMQETSSSEESE